MARVSGTIYVFCVLAVSLMVPMAASAAVVAKKIPATQVFRAPSKPLYYYPGTEFAFAACGPRDDDFRFGVTLDTAKKSYVLKYAWVAPDTDPKAQFQALSAVQLELKSGYLTFTSYGSTISVSLSAYVKSDRRQQLSQGRSKTVWGQDLYIQDPIANKASPVLVDLDKLVVEALRVLAKAARTFAKTSVPYTCREKKTTPGHPTLANLATYLTSLQKLTTAKW